MNSKGGVCKKIGKEAIKLVENEKKVKSWHEKLKVMIENRKNVNRKNRLNC